MVLLLAITQLWKWIQQQKNIIKRITPPNHLNSTSFHCNKEISAVTKIQYTGWIPDTCVPIFKSACGSHLHAWHSKASKTCRLTSPLKYLHGLTPHSHNFCRNKFTLEPHWLVELERKVAWIWKWCGRGDGAVLCCWTAPSGWRGNRNYSKISLLAFPAVVGGARFRGARYRCNMDPRKAWLRHVGDFITRWLSFPRFHIIIFLSSHWTFWPGKCAPFLPWANHCCRPVAVSSFLFHSHLLKAESRWVGVVRVWPAQLALLQ